jgi:hypothetical protein
MMFPSSNAELTPGNNVSDHAVERTLNSSAAFGARRRRGPARRGR